MAGGWLLVGGYKKVVKGQLHPVGWYVIIIKIILLFFLITHSFLDTSPVFWNLYPNCGDTEVGGKAVQK